MTNLRDAQIRSALISERIRQRTDLALRELIVQYQEPLTFHPLDDLMISGQAWRHVELSDIDPKLVFAHPELLRRHPMTSQYYRGLALLPRKRVTDIAGSVDSWENGTRKAPIPGHRSKDVARLYNAVISSIIEGAANWTLENGYRNIIATMGIGLDGTFRNIIGQDAEDLETISKLSKEVFTPILTFPRQGGRDSSAAFMASLHIYIPLLAHQGRGEALILRTCAPEKGFEIVS